MSESLKIDVIAKSLGIKSLVDLRAGFQMIGDVISTVKGVVMDLTGAYARQEVAEAKLKSAVGGNIDELVKFSSEMQNLTTLGDEAVLEIMQFGKSLGIQTSKLNESAQGAIGLSKAFGVDLHSAMKMVAMAGEDEYGMLSRFIPALKTATTNAEKHAIVQKAMADGFKLARAEADTFSGRLEQLKNAQDEIKEVGGKLISVYGKDFVKSMTDSAKEITEFLSKAENMEKIITTVEIVGAVFENLGQVIKLNFKMMYDMFITPWILAGKVLWEVIKPLADVKNKIAEVASGILDKLKPAIDFFAEMFGKAKEKITAFTGETVKNLKEKLPEGVKNGLDVLGKEIKKTADSYKDEVGKFANPWVDLKGNIKKKIDDYNNVTKDAVGTGTRETKETLIQELKRMTQEAQKAWDDLSPKGKLDKALGEVLKWGQAMTTIASMITSTIQSYYDMMYSNMLNKEKEMLDEKLTAIDEAAQAELEARGLQEESKAEILQKEIDTLQESLAKAGSTEKKKRIQDEINAKQNEKKKIEILENAERQKIAAQEEAAKKEKEIKKKQFKDNQNLQVANIWINAASAVIGYWAAFSGMGIAGIVLAAIMTTAVLALAGVQTGIVMSQNPSFATGVENFAGGVARVHKDEALVNLPAGTDVIRKNEVAGYGARETSYGIYIENMTVISNDPNDFAEQMNELRRKEINR